MRQNKFTISLFCLLFSFSTGIQAQTNEKLADKVQKADSLFNKWASDNSGGASIAVVKNGEIVFSNAYGMANLEYGIPNTVNTIFHAASLSKQFTAYSILLLEQEGKLSLNDDIRKYIPQVPDFGEKITLYHLANHLSGLKDQWRLLYLAGWRPDDVILNTDILDLVSNQTDLNFYPGSKVMYCNTGFTLLAEVVSRVSGKTFAEFTKENIFDPLEMSNTQFYDDHNKIVKNRAYSYKNEGETLKKDKLNFSTVGATSLFTTVNDLCKWAIHLNTLSKKDSLLSQKMNQQAHFNNGEITESAMGQWTGAKYKGMEWFDHSGSDASFRAYLARFPETNSAVVVLANTTPFNATSKALKTANIFLSEYFKTETKPTESQTEEHKKEYDFIQLPTKLLNEFCGKYLELEDLYDREIKIVNDTLVYYRSKSSQTKLLPVSKNEFKMLGDSKDVSVFFENNEHNEPIMRLNIGDERTVTFVKYNQNFPIDDYKGSYYSPEVNGKINAYTENGSIYLAVLKQEPVELKPIKKDLFTSSNRNFKKIEFIRNPEDEISKLLISNSGIVNMKYDKE